MEDHRSGKRKLMKADLITKLTDKPPNMANSTLTDVNFGNAWYNRIVAKLEHYQYFVLADKQINKIVTVIHPPNIRVRVNEIF